MRTAGLLTLVVACSLLGCGDGSHSEGEDVAQGEDRIGGLTVPEAAVQAYLDAMSRGEAHTDLPMLSPDSQTLMTSWRVRPAQMAGMVTAYRSCHAEPALIDATGTLAVVRYPQDERTCSPWFLRRDGDTWQIDLVSGQALIRFGRDNAWRFDTAQIDSHAYAFGFTDWSFDNAGFPH